MTERLEALGFRRWQKNGMDRIYINFTGDEEYDDHKVRVFFNRYEWSNLKVYWDVKKEELVITAGSTEAQTAVAAIVNSMVA